MVDSKELMIGNIVKTPYGVKVVSCVGMYRIQWDNDEDKGNYLLERCEGIELTPELLEKAGFVKTGNDTFHLNGIRLERGSYSHQNEFFFNWGYIKDRVYLKFLHQLQNLIYCLTGEALEVKM